MLLDITLCCKTLNIYFFIVVENQMELAKQHLDQYKAMLAANEEALSELNKVN